MRRFWVHELLILLGSEARELTEEQASVLLGLDLLALRELREEVLSAVVQMEQRAHCKRCGVRITVGRVDKAHCSPACRVADHRDRQRRLCG